MYSINYEIRLNKFGIIFIVVIFHSFLDCRQTNSNCNINRSSRCSDFLIVYRTHVSIIGECRVMAALGVRSILLRRFTNTRTFVR